MKPRVRLVLVVAASLTLTVPLLVNAVSRAVEPKPGQAGQFNASCPVSHRGPDDPIVFPGQPGRSHSHDFSGNKSTNAFSTEGSLTSAGTTCKRPADRSAYWFPTAYEDGAVLHPAEVTVYYRTARRDPASITPFPKGFRMIAGDSKHQTIQPETVIHWGCDQGTAIVKAQPPSGSPKALAMAEELKEAASKVAPALRAVKRERRALRRLRRGGVTRSERPAVRRRRAALKRKQRAYRGLLRTVERNQKALQELVRASNVSVPTCPGTKLEVLIRFPDCWDGTHLDSADHMSHVAYSDPDRRGSVYRTCPRSHPVAIPKLAIEVRYPTVGGPGVSLASGLGYTAHADFFNAWDPETFARLVRDCLNADGYCGKGNKPGPKPAPAPPGPAPGSPPAPKPPPPRRRRRASRRRASLRRASLRRASRRLRHRRSCRRSCPP